MDTNLQDIHDWASQQAISLLAPLGDRLLHVQGVVDRANWISTVLNEQDHVYLVAAAYLHDIGYAPSLRLTGFHPIDGAYYLKAHNQERLASLVAYHSASQFEASLRSLSSELEVFPHEYSLLADALTYCDMTTNSKGQKVSFQERLDDIFSRYDKTDIVSRAIHQAAPFLKLSVERIEHILCEV